MSAKDVITQFNVKLHQQLPLDDDVFYAMAKQANLFPLNTGNAITAESTRAKKVSYFLHNVVEPGAEQYLPKLLKVMKDSEAANVVMLADEIQTATIVGRLSNSYSYNNYVIVIYNMCTRDLANLYPSCRPQA